ncbi:MAG: PorT family protein [Bacteroidetes bacterium]|nr:PorT family protein [Bacteroidota bacterium]
MRIIAHALLVSLLFFFNGEKGYGQEFNGGAFWGLNASQVDRDGYGGYNKLGFNAGAFVNREFSTNFYWQAELKYGGRGAFYQGENVVEDFHKTSFQYVELPLSVQYLHEEKFQAGIGLSADVLIKFTAYDDQRNEVPLEALGGNRRFGFNAFAGVHYWFLPSLGVGLRFTYSVVPYSLREGASVRYLDSGYFHNVLSLTMAYKIQHR